MYRYLPNTTRHYLNFYWNQYSEVEVANLHPTLHSEFSDLSMPRTKFKATFGGISWVISTK